MARFPQPKPRHEAPPPFDPSIYSFEELLELKRSVDTEVQSRQAKEAEELRARVTETAQSLGISIEELLRLPSAPIRRETRKTKHARGKQPARYRGPGGEEWSGRGPHPRWMKPYLAKGKTKADFLIEKH
jgi:DNA-binding protein H-NS